MVLWAHTFSVLCFHIVFVVVHACAHDQCWKSFLLLIEGHLCVLFCMASKIFRSYYVMGLLLSVCTQYYLCSSWSWRIVDYWHGIKAGINFVYCSSTRFQTTDANMQKWVLLFFIFLDQDSWAVPITWHLSSGNFAFWSSREPLGQIGSTLM